MENTGAVSPIGRSAAEAADQRAARSATYRNERERFRKSRAVAWMVIKLRMKHNLTQQELAALVGTSHSVIARIENGRTRTTSRTVRRIVSAVGDNE